MGKESAVIEKEEGAGGENGSANEEGTENENLESKPEEGADPYAAGGDGEGGEGGEHAAGEGEGAEGEAEQVEGEEKEQIPTPEERIEALQEQIRQLTEKIEKSPEKKDEAEEKSKPVTQKTEAEWTALSEESGLPVPTLRFIETNQMRMVQGILSHVTSLIEKRFGNFDKDRAFTELSRKPEFKDIGNYRNSIEESLKRYNTSQHSNPELLAELYYAAKGRGADKKIGKIINTNTVTRKVVKKIAPTNGSSGTKLKGKGPDLRLTEQEESIYQTMGKSAGMTREEYARSLKRNRGK